MSQKRQPDERKAGSEGSSQDEKPSKIPAIRRVIDEVIRRHSIQKFLSTIEPLVRRVVKEEIEVALANHLGSITRQSGKEILPTTARSLQLQFKNTLSLPIFTGSRIEGENSSTISIVLVDALSGQVVTSGQESFMKVEIVVLEGDFEGDEEDNWTFEEFKNYMVREREGRRSLLTGDVCVDLNQGTGVVGELSFTDNSSWTRSRKFRLGARTADGYFNGMRVREAKTEAFMVKDHRGELYKKHYPPSLMDEVWRLEKIGKDGAFHKRLSFENIYTVKDFLTLLCFDATRLRNILGSGMSAKMWEVTVEHARSCILGDQIHIYHPDGQNKTGVVFNIVGELKGMLSGQQFLSVHELTDKDKAEAHEVVKQAYEHWNDVVTCDAGTLLSKPLHSLHSGSTALHDNMYTNFPSPLLTDGFDLSHSNIPSPDIFSVGVARTFDACSLQSVENAEFRYDLESQVLAGRSPCRESRFMENFSPLIFDDCNSQTLYCGDSLQYMDSSFSSDTADIGNTVRGYITRAATTHGRAYRGWRTVSSVVRLIFHVKRIVASKRKEHGKGIFC
ncbi:calmodulin-binding protein 60 A-like [Typha angustifolia]|uniref:calmodulin-binding protein 60 A-like n=1 Tax=Typha angustifolia TaxID=59011 RepID=UPI003C2C6AC0